MTPEEIEAMGEYEGERGPRRVVTSFRAGNHPTTTTVGYFRRGERGKLHLCSLWSFSRWAKRRV